MIISSGWAKGLDCKAPHGMNTRPTSAKVRAAVFNILQSECPGSTILDIYAGSGAIGIEALSRGAQHVDFVECHEAALKALKLNLKSLSERAKKQSLPPPASRILATAAAKALTTLREQGAVYDVIFLDPPYAAAADAMRQLAPDLAILSKADGLVVLESATSDRVPVEEVMQGPGARLFTQVKQRAYGATMISFWQRSSSGDR